MLPAIVVINTTVIKANITQQLFTVVISPIGPAKVIAQAGLPGPTGPQGIQGIQGIQGPQGTDGITQLTGDILATGPGAVIAALKAIPHKVYVDYVLGSDAGTGTITSPWKTLQHAYNSISPSINEPYVIYLSGGNNSTEPGPITGKADVSIIADYGIQVPGITITSPVANSNGCTFVNLTFLGAVTWIRNDIFSSGVTFINCGTFVAPVIKNTSTGACSVQALNSFFVGCDFKTANGGYAIFIGCTFYGTCAFGDPGTSGASYIQFQACYSSSAMTITGNYNPVYFSGFIHDTAFGASLSFVSGTGGMPVVVTDSSGLPASITDAPAVTKLSQAKWEAYVAATPADWNVSAPSDVGAALDRIAAALSALGHKP